MISKVALLLISLVSFTAFAAETIECKADGGKKVVASLVAKGQSRGSRVYEITLDESISSSYFTVEDRGLVQTKSAKADILEDWDGNSGVKISFGKDFLTATQGATSRAYVRAYYNDIAQDSVSNVLSCTVTK